MQRFEAASPAARYQLLRDALDAPRLSLDRDSLAHAMATVSQMLARCNHFDAQLALAETLRRRALDVYAMILPVQRLLLLQEALFRDRPDETAGLITHWCKAVAGTPTSILVMALRFLLGYGQTGQALRLADAIVAETADEELQEVARALPVDACLEGALSQQLAGGAVAWKPIERRLAELGLDKETIQDYRSLLSTPAEERLAGMQQACADRDGTLYAWMLPGFGAWMLAQHGLSLLLSRELLGQALALWDWCNEKRELSGHVGFSRAQLEDYLDAPAGVTGLEQFDVVLLIWGLPYVYDWLVSLGICTPRRRSLAIGHLEAVKPWMIGNIGLPIWSYSFVHGWPAPASSDPAFRAAEASSFRAARNQTLPLGTRPEDNRQFDPPDLPEAIFVQILALLAEQDLRGVQLLEAVMDQLGPDQMLRVQALIASLPEKPPPQATPPSARARRKLPAPSPAPATVPRAARYRYYLNPFPELGFTRCPKCQGPTRLRKFNLLVLVEAARQVVCLDLSHKFCPGCELLIIQRSALERELGARLPATAVDKGQGYQLLGTLDRKDHKAAETGRLSAEEINALRYPFRQRLWFHVVPPHWCSNEPGCRVCLAAAAEMPE